MVNAILLKDIYIAPGVRLKGTSGLELEPDLSEEPVGPVDIAIDKKGRITAIGQSLEAPPGAEEVTGEKLYVSPGWIDLHTHIYASATDFSLDPDRIGPATGVAALVDAGSAGEANFAGFVRYIIERTPFPVLAYLNIGSIGLTAANRVSEVAFDCSIDVKRTINCGRRYAEHIVGVKARVCSEVVGEAGIKPLLAAREAAEALGLPLIVHIGRARPTLAEILAELRPGDMVTHIFHGKEGNSLLQYEQEVAEAAERGIWLDVGHGAASFSYQVAERALSLGILPRTISTDLHGWNVNGPVWDLAATMSKMLAVGMRLGKVIEAVTVNPATFLRRPEWGEVAVGRFARLTVFELVGGRELPDSLGEKRQLDKLLIPRYTVLGNRLVQASSLAGRKPA